MVIRACSPKHGLGAVLGLVLMAAGALAMPAEEWIYTVRPGDTLWGITARFLKDLSFVGRLQSLNRVVNPRTLPPGLELRIPVDWSRLQPVSGRVRTVTGEVTALMGGAGPARAVVPDMELRAGDVLRTGPDGNVMLEYFDGYRLRLDSDSELSLRALDAYAGTPIFSGELLLPRGRIESHSPPRHDPATRFRVNTPGGVTSTRGTQFRVNVEAESATARTEVLDGGVDVTGGGRSLGVDAGFGSIARSGQPPTEPTPLLAAPDLNQFRTLYRMVPMEIAIAPLSGARGYRVQIAADPSFSAVLFDATSSEPAFRGPDLPDGHYLLRARGIDVEALEGRDAVGKFEIDARPLPPVLLEPKDGSIVSVSRPTFGWTLHTEHARYHLQLAEDAEFERLLFDVTDWRSASWTPERPLPPGRYYWRMAARNEREGDGPFGDRKSFRLPPEPPVLTAPQLKERESTMTLAWSAAAGAHGYDVQVSRDKDFGTLVHEARTDLPEATLAKPIPGLYYVRVRSVDADGTPSPFTEPQTFRREPPPPKLSGEVSPAALVFRWPSGLSGWRYDIQVAQDASFASVLDTVRTAETTATIARAAPGLYHVRVRVVDVDGFEGPFSTPIQIRREPPPPELGGQFTDSALVLNWPAGMPGWRYDIQVAKDEQFAKAVETVRTSGSTVTIPWSASGLYRARARTVDVDGFEGPFSAPLTLRRAPSPPDLTGAASDDGFVLQWPEGQNGWRYVVQVTKNERFAPLLDSVRTAATTVAIKAAPGLYRVRIRTVDVDGFEGPFGMPVTLLRGPPPPELEWAEMLARELTVSWGLGSRGDTYRVQLARDESFSEILWNATATGGVARTQLPAPGRYFLRIRATTARGIDGPFGPPQAFSVPNSPLMFWTRVDLRKAKRP